MANARLNLAIKSLAGASLVEADGELGPWTMDAFTRAMKQVAQAESELVVVDLTHVSYMDVGALRVLKDTCSALGPSRKLCAVARGQARTVLEATRFDEVVGIYPSVNDALSRTQEQS